MTIRRYQRPHQILGHSQFPNIATDPPERPSKAVTLSSQDPSRMTSPLGAIEITWALTR